jgi:tRNA threonylcarbamoyladenosine biosynthesis protein TsaE
VAFSGDLGAGKTTLVRELMSMMGATGEVNSPTFGIINEYRTGDNRKVCHTDWYRIKDAAELMDTGIQEYLDDPDCLILIEWPEVGQSLLTGEEVLFVEIEHAGEQRIYHLNLRH